jgi:hypothetical protein
MLAMNLAGAQQFGSQELLPGMQLWQGGRPLDAAQAWAAAAARAKGKHDPEILRRAAMASTLACIAYERTGRARAYGYWADAVRLSLEAGESWPAQREALAARVRRLERNLAAQTDGTAPVLGPEEKLLLFLSRDLQLVRYDGPKPGLKDDAEITGASNTIFPQYLEGSGTQTQGESLDGKQSPWLRTGEAQGRAATAAEGTIRAMNIAPRSLQAPPTPVGRSDTDASADGGRALALSGAQDPANTTLAPGVPVPGKLRELDDAELAAAAAAWRYVSNNRQDRSGLINGRDGYPVATVEDVAMGMGAYLAAMKLGLVAEAEGTDSIRRILDTLATLPLYGNELPNRAYDSRNGRMLDLGETPSNDGSGWAIHDIAQLLFWLKVLEGTEPELATAARAIPARFRFQRAVARGTLTSIVARAGREEMIADTAPGVSQLSAAYLGMWGIVLPRMLGYASPLRPLGDHGPSPEIYAKGMIQVGGMDACFRMWVRQVQEGLLSGREAIQESVSLADEWLDKPPWFAALRFDPAADRWHFLDLNGEVIDWAKTYSLRAAVLWAAVRGEKIRDESPAGRILLERGDHGLYGGRYASGELNRALSLETNASVLLALWFRQRNSVPLLELINPLGADCAQKGG